MFSKDNQEGDEIWAKSRASPGCLVDPHGSHWNIPSPAQMRNPYIKKVRSHVLLNSNNVVVPPVPGERVLPLPGKAEDPWLLDLRKGAPKGRWNTSKEPGLGIGCSDLVKDPGWYLLPWQ